MTKLSDVERRVTRIEKILWYVAASLTIKYGADIIPTVSAYLKS